MDITIDQLSDEGISVEIFPKDSTTGNLGICINGGEGDLWIYLSVSHAERLLDQLAGAIVLASKDQLTRPQSEGATAARKR